MFCLLCWCHGHRFSKKKLLIQDWVTEQHICLPFLIKAKPLQLFQWITGPQRDRPESARRQRPSSKGFAPGRTDPGLMAVHEEILKWLRIICLNGFKDMSSNSSNPLLQVKHRLRRYGKVICFLSLFCRLVAYKLPSSQRTALFMHDCIKKKILIYMSKIPMVNIINVDPDRLKYIHQENEIPRRFLLQKNDHSHTYSQQKVRF